MRTIRRMFGVLIALTALGGIASGLGALVLRGRLRSSGGETDDAFDLVGIFEAFEVRSRAGALRRCSILAWYGGGTIDLRGATLDPAGANLSLRAIFGGLRLVVPSTWRVETNVVGIGGAGDARDQSMVEAGGPVLSVSGWAIFGGVGIVDEAPDLDAPSSPEDGQASATATA